MTTSASPLRLALLVGLSLSLGACGAAGRLQNIGQAPALSPIENPVTSAGYRPVQMPMPAPEVASYSPNSLWRSGARSFFKDQRARQVGDIVTVIVSFSDQAQISNQTTRNRASTEAIGTGGSLDNTIINLIPGVEEGVGAAVDTSNSSSSSGRGSVNRSESLATSVAAVVTQVLPNGNLVIEGKQEVRVNFEVRELIIAGIVRPEDIAANNTIDSTKIAQARIAYGGRGQITDVQQPRYGQQVLDIILPF